MLRFRLSNKNERRHFEHRAGPLEFGRSPQPDGTPRCVVQDPCVSKSHLRVQELPGGRLQLENLSQKYPVYLPNNRTLASGTQCEVVLPIRLAIGETVLAIDVGSGDPFRRELLETVAPPVHAHRLPEAPSTVPPLGPSSTPEMLTHWFETVMAVQRAAIGSPDFYEQTARALVDLVGLDRGLVLLRQENNWQVAARAARAARAEGDTDREFSHTILRYVLEEQRTFYQASTAEIQNVDSSRPEAVVVSPICDTDEQIVGVVYGCRTRANRHGDRSIGALEAQVVQLLASTVGVGLARQTQGDEALRLRLAKAAVEEANQAKSHRLATLNHELRTPLDATLGSSELLQKEASDLGQTRFLAELQTIHVAAQHLLRLLNDLSAPTGTSGGDTPPSPGTSTGERGTSAP